MLRTGVSSLIYGIGLASLLLADLLAASFLPTEELARWSFLRSGLYFFASLVLLGRDNLLVREPAVAPALLARFRWQIPAISIVLASLLAAAGKLPFGLGLAACVAVSVSTAGYQFHLGGARRVAAQYTFQSWKVAVLVVVAMIVWGWVPVSRFDIALSVALGLAAILTISPILAAGGSREPSMRKGQLAWADRMGWRYFITSTLAAAGIYGEALLLGLFASAQDQALWFTHLTFFVLPATALGGLVGFLAIPAMRTKPATVARLFTRTGSLAIILFALIAGGMVQLAGWLTWSILDPEVGAPASLLWLMAAVGAVLRLIYVAVSSYFAIHGDVPFHDRLIGGQMLSLVLGLVAGWIIFAWGENLIFAIVAGGLVNVAGRSLIGLVLALGHANQHLTVVRA